MKQLRKVLQVVFSICLMTSLVNIGAFAEEDTTSDAGREVEYGLEEKPSDTSVSREIEYGLEESEPSTTDSSSQVEYGYSTLQPQSQTPTKSDVLETNDLKDVDNKKDEEILKTQADEDVIISFDNNSGNGTMGDVSIRKGNEYTLPKCTFTKDGFEFAGWDVNGTIYQENNKVRIDNNTTIMATWKLWEKGTITYYVRLVSNDQTRNDWQHPSGGIPSSSGSSVANWSNRKITLYDENMNVLQEGNTDITTTSFSGLKEGTYYIKVDTLMPTVFLKDCTNPFSEVFLTEETSKVVVSQSKPNQTVFWIAMLKAYSYGLITKTGAFNNGTQSLLYYKGEQGYFVSNGRKYQTHNGILYGDSAQQYDGMNDLEIPTLSKEEQEKGYFFNGWKDVSTGEVLSTAQALGKIIKENTTFEAVWDYPIHTVIFKTNSDYGDINGSSSYSYQRSFNNQLVDDIPSVKAKEGYEFIGWFNDLSVNVIPESEIYNTKINQNLNFYAKYRKTTSSGTPKSDSLYHVTFIPGERGTIKGYNAFVVSSGNSVSKTPTITPTTKAGFTGQWKVVAINENDLGIEVGDILTSEEILSTPIGFDVLLEAVYEKVKYTVTYEDGLGNVVFSAQHYEDLPYGAKTPVFTGKLERDGYVFAGWHVQVSDTVKGDMTYIATWVNAKTGKVDEPDVGNRDKSIDSIKKDEKVNIPKSETNSSTTGHQTSTGTWITLILTGVLGMIGVFYKRKSS